MKTPEEIKKGLECRKRGYAEQCGYECAKCDVYVPGYVIRELLNDVLAYIKQLEDDNAELKESLDYTDAANTELYSALENAQRERDAAVEDIPRICEFCKRNSTKYLADGMIDDVCVTCLNGGHFNWKWRGVQEVGT